MDEVSTKKKENEVFFLGVKMNVHGDNSGDTIVPKTMYTYSYV